MVCKLILVINGEPRGTHRHSLKYIRYYCVLRFAPEQLRVCRLAQPYGTSDAGADSTSVLIFITRAKPLSPFVSSSKKVRTRLLDS